MNIAGWLNQSTIKLHDAEVVTARLDALVLLEDCLELDRARILGHPEIELSPGQLTELQSKLKRRLKHVPLAYIRGQSEFYGRRFAINEHVLVPRPESEMIIDQLLALDVPPRTVIIDVGTGSGALAVTAKLELPHCSVVATDVDETCILTARSNAERHNADVTFTVGNLLIPAGKYLYEMAVLLCNLPYVPAEHAINRAAGYEPSLALFSGKDGLDHYQQLFAQITASGVWPQYIITESMPDQHKALQMLAADCGYQVKQAADFIQVLKRTG